MIAGPNGSGKTTLTNELRNRGVEFGEYLNADDIAVSINGSPIQAAADAQARVRMGREAALVRGTSHCFETVMSHPSHIEYMQKARKAGFETRLMFIATENPVINAERVANRVLHGGHDVPRDRIVARYGRCLENLPAAVAACDHCLIFDNSSAEHPLRMLAEIRHTTEGWEYNLNDSYGLETLAVPNWWNSVLPLLLNLSSSIGKKIP